MSISTFTGIQTSLRGLLAQQRALDVTSHNIANATTVGYTRQEATLAATTPLAVTTSGGATAGSLGTGVDVQSYRRVRDQFLDLQYRAQNMSLGEQTARSDALQDVELSFAEPGDTGIASALDKFWSAWGDLSNSADSGPARQAVIDQARTTSTQINDLQKNLGAARQRAADEYAQTAGAGGEVNQMATDLASTLNAIRAAEMTGAQPNDLYDRRDVILDKLSEMGQVSVSPSGSGNVDVSIGGAVIVSSDATGTASVPAGAFPPAYTSGPGGRLGALLDLASGTGSIASYQRDLAAFAQSLADSVNGIYSATGTNFFVTGTDPSTNLPTIALNEPAVSVSTLKAGIGGPAENGIALQISGLAGGAADGSYRQLVTRMGNEVAQVKRQEATAQTLTDNLSNRRDSTSGVSLDEEMTNIIRFQRAYQASARAMSTTDEMLDTLINRAGRVGL
jgi:flagellar hook-associated protein 1